jgi:hypothetical protein
MDVIHVSELSHDRTLGLADELPMLMGAGSIDPDLIAPHEPDPETDDLIAFGCL